MMLCAGKIEKREGKSIMTVRGVIKGKQIDRGYRVDRIRGRVDKEDRKL